jgi:hypothetical protein
MIQSNVLVPVLLAGLLSIASVGCLGAEPPANSPSTATAAPEATVTRPEGAADSVNTTPGSGNTGNGSPGPEGGPGSLGPDGIGSGSGTGTGAGPGNSGTTSGATSH